MTARSFRRGLLLPALAGLCIVTAARADSPASSAEQNYVLRCQGCHGADGVGVAHKIPSLRDSVGKLIRRDDGRDFLLRVPGASNSALSDAALAGVLNWLVERFAGEEAGKGTPDFTAAEVMAARRRPLVGVHRARLEIATRLAAAGLSTPVDY